MVLFYISIIFLLTCYVLNNTKISRYSSFNKALMNYQGQNPMRSKYMLDLQCCIGMEVDGEDNDMREEDSDEDQTDSEEIIVFF